MIGTEWQPAILNGEQVSARVVLRPWPGRPDAERQYIQIRTASGAQALYGLHTSRITAGAGRPGDHLGEQRRDGRVVDGPSAAGAAPAGSTKRIATDLDTEGYP